MTDLIKLIVLILIGVVLAPMVVYVTTKLIVVAFYRGRRLAKELEDKEEKQDGARKGKA